MDDSFSFRTTVPLRRRFDPLTVKAAVFGTLVVLGIGLFANWVISSERESFSRAARHMVPSGVEAAPVDSQPHLASSDADAEKATGIDAGPAQLSAALQPGYTWAAAVRGSGGMCHWIRVTSAGNVSHGTGLECTGTAALTPSVPR